MPRPLLLAVLTLGALACSVAAPQGEVRQPSEEPKYGGRLNTRVSGEPRQDWDLSYSGKSSPTDAAIALQSNTLLRYENGPDLGYTQMVLRPGLAERWEVSPDARSFTFKLREGVRFADVPPVSGRALTSADVKWNMEYQSREGEFKVGARHASPLPAGQFSWMYEGLDRIEAPDRTTAVVHFKSPFVPFFAYATSQWNPILAREIYDRDGHMKDQVAGTGPYVIDLAASQKGTRWVFKKNPNYFETGKPYLDEIRWLVLPEESTAYAGFQTQQVDLLTALPYNDAQDVLKNNPQAMSLEYLQPLGYQIYISQARQGPLNDLRVRQALALSIDRDEILRVVAGGKGAWSPSGSIHGLFSDEEAKRMLKHDPAEARRLLAQAGFGDGVNLEWIVVRDESQANLTWIQLVQAQAKKVGININLRLLERIEQRNRKYAGDYDLDYGSSLGRLEVDLDSYLYAGYHSASTGNWAKVKDPELDKLLEAQRREVDPEKRRQQHRSAVQRLVDMAWAVDLIYPPKYSFWHSYVKNFRPHFGTKTDYPFVWLDK